MKKKLISFITVVSLLIMNTSLAMAEEDYSNEEYWYSKCSQVLTSQEDINACAGFTTYQEEKSEDLQSQVEQYTQDISDLETSIEDVIELARQQKELADSLQSEITIKEESLETIQLTIDDLDVQIEEKQEEIDTWDEQVKTRMRSEQSSLGTNMFIDFIMSSQDLNDMLKRINGIQRITEDDEKQITQLNELKEQIVSQKSEQERLQNDIESEKESLETEKSDAETLQASYEQLEETYRESIADLQAQIREAEQDISDIQNFVITADFQASIVATDEFTFPIGGGYYSAGTWEYPDGGMHLGLDWAADIGTPVYAPANGIIIYANNPVTSDCGYLGNWCGWPLGGGNTIEMLCLVDGTLYAVSFAHLAQEDFLVSSGDSVVQGQQIAATGNSGNSTGGHCHMEIINLGSMSVEEAISYFSGTADFAFGTGWSSPTACGSAPCRERPEEIFGVGE